MRASLEATVEYQDDGGKHLRWLANGRLYAEAIVHGSTIKHVGHHAAPLVEGWTIGFGPVLQPIWYQAEGGA